MSRSPRLNRKDPWTGLTGRCIALIGLLGEIITYWRDSWWLAVWCRLH